MKMQLLKLTKNLLLFFVLLCLTVISIPEKGNSEVLFVQGNKVNLRSQPNQNSEILWEYANGFPLEVLKSQGDWKMVRDFENDSGWIHKSLLQQGKQVIVKVNKNGDSKINIRSGPGTNNQIVGNAYYGVVFAAVQKKGSWTQVHHESGLTGWVKTELLWGL